MVSCEIFSEDAYGPEFFKRLVERLKKENIVDESLYVKTQKLPGICYTKSERAIKAASIDFDYLFSEDVPPTFLDNLRGVFPL